MSQEVTHTFRAHHRLAAAPLLGILLVALIVRGIMWVALPRQGLISDEGEYLSAAWWLAQGRGFAWHQNYLWTRAPLYPLFIAAHLRLFGDGLAAIAGTQTALSLLNILLIHLLARRITPPALHIAPYLAAFFAALYLPFAIYSQLLLSETLYISLLLGGFLALTASPATGRRQLAADILAGVLLGLATLTRSQTLFVLPLLAGWLAFARRDHHGSAFRSAAAFAIAATLTIAPWTIYNSRAYGGLVLVDTSGAYNLLLGAWTAHNGERRNEPTRSFVLAMFPERGTTPPARTCLPHPGPQPDQAARQTAMIREGICLIADRPLAFASKSLAEFIDFFQINYTGAERFTSGFSTGRLPIWFVVATFLLDDTLYVLSLPLAVLGWALVRHHSSAASDLRSLIGIWLAFNVLLAPLLFAINRFRVPLLPFVFILAAIAVDALIRHRSDLAAALRTRHGISYAGLAVALTLTAATPHAYLEPRASGSDSRWASYLGPYPSSLAITGIAITARPLALNDARFLAALQSGDLARAESILRAGSVGRDTSRLGPALIAARRGQYRDALALLPSPDTMAATGDVYGSVVRGDLLRSLGDDSGARAAFTPYYVDSANPVQWAWDWLHPAPSRSIDLGGNLDLGYIAGCYLGEGDAAERTTYRWCTSGAMLRFPGAGRTHPQRIVFTVDGRGWPADLQPTPPVHVLVEGDTIGAITPDRSGPRAFELPLPATSEGADVVIELRGASFVPDAARYLSQQSEHVTGQVQRLMVRLDRVEIIP